MIVDAVAGFLVVTGSLLAALGGLGLLRFPDVFTRMHAATKVATVGVIATTAAAAAEAGALSGVLVLVLVILLLFLAAPLGISLLARAAYHDPQTPRAPATRELSVSSTDRPARTVRPTGGAGPLLAVWLFVVWIALFGSFRPNVLAGGILVAVGVALTLRKVAPSWPHALLHPVAAMGFVARFSVQLVAATWDVVRLLFRPTDSLRPVVFSVPVRVRTRNEVTLLMNAISFTPGTVAMELEHGELSVHMLSTRQPEAVRADVDELQELIAAAFGAGPQSQ